MGFGLLFLGYFIATLMSINKFGSFFRIVGYSIVLISAVKLNKYNRSFRLLGISALLMITVSSLRAASVVCDFLYNGLIINNDPFGEQYLNTMGYIETASSFVFNSMMLYSIHQIARETEVVKIVAASVRNFIFVCIYIVLYLIGILPFDFASDYTKYFSAPVLILYFIWVILNLTLIYSCYAKICDESDMEMSRKPSRFAFVNKMRAEFDEREQRALKEHAQYRSEKRKKRKNRRG